MIRIDEDDPVGEPVPHGTHADADISDMPYALGEVPVLRRRGFDLEIVKSCRSLPNSEVESSFPYRDVKIQRGVDVKEFYDLHTEIGRGKFGTVYKCREKATGLQLAAKFVSTARKEDRRNMEREIDIMRELQHPRLIQLYDAFEMDKTTVVVLELIEGGELFERVIDDDFILTEKSCTIFMRQICEGMEFIHKKNILHLDMKPENILCLTRTGNRIKIIDFGLARKFDPDKKLQVLFGTPEFVAPEVVNFDRIGYETDMWSIGVICYVLLSGLSPFMGETDIETMANVTIAKWDFEDEAFNEISEDAKDFIRKLLVKDKEKRSSASQCLSHPWLRRKPPKRPAPETKLLAPSELDLAKDNLRCFVERWSEHPNSPYLFDTNYHMISPCVSSSHVPGIRSRAPSMEACSPSPCGSIASLPDVTDSPPRSPKLFRPQPVVNPPILGPKNYLERLSTFERRASDSSCFVRHNNDFVGRINLAEEIKKLSDKLLKFNSSNNCNIVNSTEKDMAQGRTAGETNYFCSSVSTKSTIYNQIDESHGHRKKYNLSNRNRDVSFASPCWSRNSSSTQSSSSSHSAPPSPTASPEPPDMTKDLLNLLDKFEDLGDYQKNNHRMSLSVDWSDVQSLGQRTMKSLTNYIQNSRGTNVEKKKKSLFSGP